MADIIITAILAAAVFFILKSRLNKFRRGECGGSCAGCTGCAGCHSGGCSAKGAEEKTKD